jgi:hypothetical protein
MNPGSDGDRNACRSEELGRSSYEKSFQITFLEESAVDAGRTYGFTTRVIPNSWRYGLCEGLAGKSVAVVGNGIVRHCGAAIDAHDEVVRISSMRHWAVSSEDDGVRLSVWAGQLAFVVHGADVDERFEDVVARGTRLWALSPFHITCDAYTFLRLRRRCGDVMVLPSAAMLFDVFHAYMNAADLAELFTIAPARRHLSGMTQYELLLTGTRLVLALEACGVASLSLYGFDLFSATAEQVWFGHDLAVDHKVLAGVRRRFQESGRSFYWHDEPVVPRCDSV